MIFPGTLGELQELLTSLGVTCHWQHKGEFEMAVIEDGVSNLRLNWWPSSGELRLVGDPEQRQPLLEKLQAALE
jgi:hypothetical protein